MEHETDEVVSGVSTLAMAVDRSGPLSFADVCDLGAEVASRLADAHDAGEVHGHVGVGSVVRLDDGPWRLAPAELVPDVEPVLAPELHDGEARTAAGDVYALGAVLSFGLTGVAIDPVGPAGGGGSGVESAHPAPDLSAAPPAGDPPPGDLELSPHDLDRLRGFGDDVDGDADGPGDTSPGDDDELDLTDESDAPVTLPEVMSSFLVALRSSLAVDAVDRPSAASFAATLAQLRRDADSALGGALVGGVTAVAIGGAAGAEAWGEPVGDGVPVDQLPPPPAPAPNGVAVGAEPGALAVEGTGSGASLAAAGSKAKTKKSFKDRVPLVVAAAALLVAAFLGVSLVQERNDKSDDLLAIGPIEGTVVRRTTTTTTRSLPVDLIVETTTTLPTTTTSSTSTTAPPTTEVVVATTVPTTLPSTTVAPTTAPSTTAAPSSTTTTTAPAVPFKTAKVVCATPPNAANPCRLFESPDATSAPRSDPLTNGIELQATCIKKGVPPIPSALDTWVYIIGPAPTYSGWLSATHLGGSIPPVPPCTT